MVRGGGSTLASGAKGGGTLVPKMENVKMGSKLLSLNFWTVLHISVPDLRDFQWKFGRFTKNVLTQSIFVCGGVVAGA